MSALSPVEEDVLDLCHAFDFGLERVAGMALVPSARDVPLFVPLTGREPEIQTDAPAWVVGFSGDLEFQRPPSTMTDPACVVIEGERTFFGTGPITFPDGSVEQPPTPAHPSRMPLPAPVP